MKKLLLAIVLISLGACADNAGEPPGTNPDPNPADYDVTLAIHYNQYARIPGHSGVRSDYTMTYSVTTAVRVGDAVEFASADGTVDWVYQCYSAGFGPDVQDLGIGFTDSVVVEPGEFEELPAHISERFSNDSWLDGPAVSLQATSDGVFLVHRLPGSLATGQEILCPDWDEPLEVFLPNAGAGWMIAADGSTPSAADVLNAASDRPVYAPGPGALSGWVIADIAEDADVIPVNFTREETDEMGGWTLTITGEARRA